MTGATVNGVAADSQATPPAIKVFDFSNLEAVTEQEAKAADKAAMGWGKENNGNSVPQHGTNSTSSTHAPTSTSAGKGIAIHADGNGHDARTSSDKSAYRTLDQQPYTTLSNGQKMPVVGLGTWKAKPGEVQTAVEAALRSGYRHIDCAHVYGNENEVGKALSAIFSEGVVERSQVHITSKLWNSDHAQQRVRPACMTTLKHLQLEYLDLYLIHWPVTGNVGPTLQPPIEETWKAMETLVDEGLVRSIGVSNFSIPKLQALLKYARIKPVVNQVEAHPYLRNEALLNYCKGEGIHLTAYSPLGSPDSAEEMKRPEDTPSPLKDATVKRIAEAHSTDIGQVLVRWAIQRGTSVLPKSSKPQRISSNLDAVSWSLTDDEMAELSNVPTQIRMVNGRMWLNSDGPYRTLKDLWDDETGAV